MIFKLTLFLALLPLSKITEFGDDTQNNSDIYISHRKRTYVTWKMVNMVFKGRILNVLLLNILLNVLWDWFFQGLKP